MPDGTTRTISKADWGQWETWRVSARYIEQLTGLNFLSNVSQTIQDIIEVDSSSSISSFTVNSNVTDLPDEEEDISASFPNSAAAGLYDLLTAILHEMGHTKGIINGYSEFDKYVKLDVIDSNGAITTQTVDVTIDNLAPTIDAITIPTNIKEGGTVQLQATAHPTNTKT